MQEILVILVFTAAVAYLGWRLYMRSQKKSDCGTECGCEPKSKLFTED